MERPRAQAKVLARIGGLAGFHKVDLEPLYQSLSLLGGELSERAMVTVPYTFDRIAIGTRVARDRLGDLVDPAQLRRLQRLAPGTDEVDIELESGDDKFAISVRAIQARSLASWTSELEALGAGTAGLDLLQRCGGRLGTPNAITDRRNADGSLRWTLHFRHGNESDDERAATRARLLEVTDLLSVTKAQRSIIEGLHDVLAKDADSHALLAIGAEHTAPTLSVRWVRVRWETVIRMMLGFYPKIDSGKRLGELAGALDAELASAMELQFGPTEPPAMRIAVTL